MAIQVHEFSQTRSVLVNSWLKLFHALVVVGHGRLLAEGALPRGDELEDGGADDQRDRHRDDQLDHAEAVLAGVGAFASHSNLPVLHGTSLGGKCRARTRAGARIS